MSVIKQATTAIGAIFSMVTIAATTGEKTVKLAEKEVDNLHKLQDRRFDAEEQEYLNSIK